MKTKLEMAHEFMMKKMETETIDNHWELFHTSWRYADAMQAEADKRKKKKQSEHVFEAIDEWQPDWSQAPDGYDWWAMDGFSGVANWYKSEPFLDDDDTNEWNVVLSIGTYREAPSFGYNGDWRNSLRKRPE